MVTAPETPSYSPAKLKAFRRTRNLTRKAAAELIGVSWRTWERWEQGRSSPDVPTSRFLNQLEKDTGSQV